MNMPTQCSKCHGVVEPGFMVDHTDVAAHQAVWASGKPVAVRFPMTEIGANERTRTVVTVRCTVCGYLESYAP